jgi:hypothetical protein
VDDLHPHFRPKEAPVPGIAEYREQVRQLRQQLATLQEQLRVADAAGERKRALDVLAEMLRLQNEFFRRWTPVPAPPGADPKADGE